MSCARLHKVVGARLSALGRWSHARRAADARDQQFGTQVSKDLQLSVQVSLLASHLRKPYAMFDQDVGRTRWLRLRGASARGLLMNGHNVGDEVLLRRIQPERLCRQSNGPEARCVDLRSQVLLPRPTSASQWLGRPIAEHDALVVARLSPHNLHCNVRRRSSPQHYMPDRWGGGPASDLVSDRVACFAPSWPDSLLWLAPWPPVASPRPLRDLARAPGDAWLLGWGPRPPGASANALKAPAPQRSTAPLDTD